MGSVKAKRRHWLTTLLAVWMFADALPLLVWDVGDLVMQWRFSHSPHVWPRPVSPNPRAGFLLSAIFYNFMILLGLFPAPHLLMVVRETALFRMLHPGGNLNALNSSINIALFGMALAMGYGLLRMREWARWCYAALCVFCLLLFFPQKGLFFYVFIITNVAIPVALLVFLFRHGLAAKPRTVPASAGENQGDSVPTSTS
jgi:hypothetical protein